MNVLNYNFTEYKAYFLNKITHLLSEINKLDYRVKVASAVAFGTLAISLSVWQIGKRCLAGRTQDNSQHPSKEGNSQGNNVGKKSDGAEEERSPAVLPKPNNPESSVIVKEIKSRDVELNTKITENAQQNPNDTDSKSIEAEDSKEWKKNSLEEENSSALKVDEETIDSKNPLAKDQNSLKSEKEPSDKSNHQVDDDENNKPNPEKIPQKLTEENVEIIDEATRSKSTENQDSTPSDSSTSETPPQQLSVDDHLSKIDEVIPKSNNPESSVIIEKIKSSDVVLNTKITENAQQNPNDTDSKSTEAEDSKEWKKNSPEEENSSALKVDEETIDSKNPLAKEQNSLKLEKEPSDKSNHQVDDDENNTPNPEKIPQKLTEENVEIIDEATRSKSTENQDSTSSDSSTSETPPQNLSVDDHLSKIDNVLPKDGNVNDSPELRTEVKNICKSIELLDCDPERNQTLQTLMKRLHQQNLFDIECECMTSMISQKEKLKNSEYFTNYIYLVSMNYHPVCKDDTEDYALSFEEKIHNLFFLPETVDICISESNFFKITLDLFGNFIKNSIDDNEKAAAKSALKELGDELKRRKHPLMAEDVEKSLI